MDDLPSTFYAALLYLRMEQERLLVDADSQSEKAGHRSESNEKRTCCCWQWRAPFFVMARK